MAKVWRFSCAAFHSSGVQVVNDLHYQTDLAPTQSEPAAVDVLASIDAHIRAAYRAPLHQSFGISSAELRECVRPGSSDVPAAASLAVNQLGLNTSADTSVPVPLAATITLRSAAALRSGRGYMSYPSPISNTYLSALRDFQGSYLTNLQALALLLDDDIATGGILGVNMHPVVYSRKRHEAEVTPFPFNVVSALVRS